MLSASSHIMLHEFMHCEIEQIMNLQYVIFDKKNLHCGIEQVMNLQYVISGQKHVINDLRDRKSVV